MSLVPIIYTSLILFFGMLMVVLLISYASFKAKGKTNPVIEEQIRKKKETTSSPKSIIYPRNNVIIENHRTEIKPNIVKNSALIYEQQPTVVSSNYFEKYDTPKPIQKQEFEQKRIVEQRPFSQTQINKNRLLIMNESSKFHQKENENTRVNREQYYKSDLSKYNILSFYSDGIENDLMSLTTVPATKAV